MCEGLPFIANNELDSTVSLCIRLGLTRRYDTLILGWYLLRHNGMDAQQLETSDSIKRA